MFENVGQYHRKKVEDMNGNEWTLVALKIFIIIVI